MKLKAKFKNLSLKKKLFLFYAFSILLPLLIISIIIYCEISDSIFEKLQYSSARSYEQANDYLEYRLLETIYLSDVVVTNSEIKSILNNANADAHGQLFLRNKLIRILQSMEGSRQYVNIRIYVPEYLSGTKDGKRIFDLKEAEEAEWYLKKGDLKVYFSPDIYLEEECSGKSVSLVRDIVSDQNYDDRIAAVRIDTDINTIETILMNAAITPNAVTYLVNEENVIIAASDKTKMMNLGLGEKPEGQFSYDKYWDNDNLIYGQLNGRNVYYIRDKIQNVDWEMITIIPETDMIDDVLRVQSIILLVMVVFIVLTGVGGAMIITWIVHRLDVLVTGMKCVQAGNLNIHLENDCSDEIGILYNNYNTMIERTSDLMEEQYRLGKKLKNAELKALQSQINPHFLYNTLDMLNWLAYSGRTSEIRRAVVALSKYYRLILNKGEDVLTLEKELQHVEYYMRIQDIRYPEKILFQQDVDEKILNGIVPKIILQPLVENAIIHGILEKKERQGTIRIKGILDDKEEIWLTVEDDGVGMDEETLSHVTDGSIRSNGSSYGVRNVNARIQMMFGEKYGITYESKVNMGTRVILHFPKQIDEGVRSL